MFKSENFLLTFYAPSPPPLNHVRFRAKSCTLRGAGPLPLPTGSQATGRGLRRELSRTGRVRGNVYQLLFRGFGRGSGSGIIRSGVRTHSGMDSTRAFSLAPAPSTRSMRGEDSSKTFMLCRERIRFTSSAGLDPSPRYRKMNRLIQISL
jgi:hypothetical protein